MVVNDDAGYLIPRGVFKSIASRLAPTGFVPITMIVYDTTPVGAWLAREGVLPADLILRMYPNYCRSEPARDGRER